MEIFEFNWQCQRCNECCKSMSTGVPLLLSDTSRIASFMNITQQGFIRKYCDYRIITDEENGVDIPLLSSQLQGRTCILFDGSGCTIHAVKPYYCKAAPLISLLFTDDGIREAFKKHCEGVGKGKRFSTSEILYQIGEEKRLEYEDILEYQRSGYSFIDKLIK